MKKSGFSDSRCWETETSGGRRHGTGIVPGAQDRFCDTLQMTQQAWRSGCVAHGAENVNLKKRHAKAQLAVEVPKDALSKK